MADEKRNQNADTEQNTKEPAGLGEHAHGHTAEIAHEQGWGSNEDERTKQPEGRPAHYGGNGYDYGAQDFGDTPAKRDNPQSADDDALLPPERKAS
jgi:hypothetical protein